jgi:septal ring factor EnvC (AmiA/AmiB activator)
VQRADRLRRAIGAALLLASGLAFAQAPPERAAEEAEARTRLEAVREEQRRIDAERLLAHGERESTLGSLREDELAVAQLAGELAAIDARIEERGQEIARLDTEAAAIELRLARQRTEIAALLRSAHAAGRHERLRILFAPEDLGRIERALAYHRYLQRDRVGRIAVLRADLDALSALRGQVEAEQRALASDRAARAGQALALEQARATRAATLRDIEARIADQSQRLAALGKDERGLLELIARLRDAIADIPKVLDGAAPFASLRGRLPWPASGAVVERFGATTATGTASEGLLIAASRGAPVRAVSHGRVAFADWLAGYGLLLILDHGDGFMSLYAHNDAVRAEVGDWVAAGEIVAEAGASGGRSESGVYFELRSRGRPLDPARWLTRR